MYSVKLCISLSTGTYTYYIMTSSVACNDDDDDDKPVGRHSYAVVLTNDDNFKKPLDKNQRRVSRDCRRRRRK